MVAYDAQNEYKTKRIAKRRALHESFLLVSNCHLFS